jgi:hypothetical protein
MVDEPGNVALLSSINNNLLINFEQIAILALFIVSNLSQVCNTPPYSLSSILQNLMPKKKQVSETELEY